MLYILPPPRAPNPPSPWASILCSGSASDSAKNTERSRGKRTLPRVRLRTLQFKTEESGTVVIGDEVDMGRNSKSLSECYFAGKGTALVLPAASEAQKSSRRSGASSNIQKHLQSMFYLLRPEETLKMAVKLESVHPLRTRYLVVVSRMGCRAEESCLLGIDCNEKTTVGLVLKVLADTAITLDGDGGFSVSVSGRHHIFKPVSVQAMWSALQTLHKVSSKARDHNYFLGGVSHSWVSYYEERIESERSCLNEWHAMDNLESKRPPSPDSVRTKPRERDETEKVIRATLKEIMMSVDLDEVTSKYIRGRLEEDLDMDLGEYKSFIDQEMLVILGQMDAPTEIFDHVYLGSEWNASNYEELQRNGVGHILNVTREIDNFFPGTFDYLNVRVYDDEKTDLLKHWDNTFKYISKARQEGSKVLVHCKMGVSRSASVVIAYAMKAYNWDFNQALKHVKEKRSCIKPNTSFLAQLETYQGILDAMKNKEKLLRSKSETNLKSPGLVIKNELALFQSKTNKVDKVDTTNLIQTSSSGQDLLQLNERPKSWSPDNNLSNNLLTVTKNPPVYRSLENLNLRLPLKDFAKIVKVKTFLSKNFARNVLLPCDNGESYSVSPNQIMHIPNRTVENEQIASVKERVNELEAKKLEKKKLVLNLQTQFDNCSSKIVSEVNSSLNDAQNISGKKSQILQKNETWDPGENNSKNSSDNGTTSICDLKSSACDEQTIQTVPEVRLRTKVTRKDADPFSNQLDKVFDREERKQQRVTVIPVENCDDTPRNCPSRQSSWSSYDSAVVLGYQGETREAPSRHSSWGSGDTRTLPSRNSSWGSYDMRNSGSEKSNPNDTIENSSSGIFAYDKEDIPWYPGTVKRTKQKLEEHSFKTNDEKLKNDEFSGVTNVQKDGVVEAINPVLVKQEVRKNISPLNFKSAIETPDVDIVEKDFNSRLSVSAPENSSMDLYPQKKLSKSVSNIRSISSSKNYNLGQGSYIKRHKTFMESLRKHKSPTDDSTKVENKSGIVKNLKKEFEAKNEVKKTSPINLDNYEVSTEERKNKVNSLPSSPINISHEKSITPTGEDLNFKELIGRFEKQDNQVSLRAKFNKPFKSKRFSCFEVSVEKSHIMQGPYITTFNAKSVITEKQLDNDFKRPPISPIVKNTAPNVVMATVIAKAAKKQQQFGKSHPLARLTIKPRHNPVYNTM